MTNTIQETHDDMQATAKALVAAAKIQGLDITKLLTAQLTYAFEVGVIAGVHMRCSEVVAGLTSTRTEGNPGTVHVHTDGCLLEAQQVMHRSIPGVIELPELIADYGHDSFTAGYMQGVEEQESWGEPNED